MTSVSDQELTDIVKKILDRMESGGISGSNDLNSSINAVNMPEGYSEANEKTDGKKIVALGTDHGGYEMKEALKAYLAELKFAIIDCGTNSKESVDYPDFAHEVARMVSESKAWRGIVIDGAGIGSCMAANKVPGVRAAMCYDYATAVNSREHNNANVLTLGAGLIGLNLAKQIVQTWLVTDFGGGRHAKRVDKIDAIESKYLKK